MKGERHGRDVRKERRERGREGGREEGNEKNCAKCSIILSTLCIFPDLKTKRAIRLPTDITTVERLKTATNR